MRNFFLSALLLVTLLCSCSHKKIKQGMVTYDIEYQLPDSLNSYKAYLPQKAIVYFKGDSTVSIQQAGAEATTVITYKPDAFMRVLLRSSAAKYVIDYSKADQPDLLPASKGYTYVATNESKIIAGYKASKYELTDQATGLSCEAWFTKNVAIVPNYLTTVFDTTYGVPLSFTTKQNGIPVTTIVKQITFEPVPNGIFAVPAGYQKITPKQFRDMPVGN
ncbi:MAG: hypothetical protein ACHQHN_03155 [Sphingobacteriales bacterium]